VSAGFGLAEVLDMTLAQVRAYSVAAERARRRHNRDLLLLMRGSQFDKAGFEKFMRALED
jgi:hypothetical protein